jgi:hypothetical protein
MGGEQRSDDNQIRHKLATGRSGPKKTIADFCGFQRA